MKKLEAQLELGMSGNLATQCTKFSKSFTSLSSTGQRSLAVLANKAQSVNSTLSTVFNKGTGILSSVGVGISGKYVGDLELRLTRLRLQAEVSKDAMSQLNNEIFKVSQQRDINIDPSELLGAVEKIVSKTGDLKFAQDNLKNIAYTISATGSAGEDVGALAADLMEKFNIKKADELLSTLGLLTAQGKAGAFELKNLAAQGGRVTAAYGAWGRAGAGAVAEMGAMLQMSQKGTGSAEQAATAFEALLRNFTDNTKIEQLKSVGISVSDPEDPKRMKSIIELSKELIRKTKGDMKQLGQVLDSEASRAITQMANEYQKTGGFASVDAFLTAKREGQLLINDSKEVAAEFNSAMTSLKTSFSLFANNNLAVPLQKLAEALNSLSPEAMQQYLEIAKKVILGLGAIWAGSKVLGMGATAMSLLGKGKAGVVSQAMGGLGGLASFGKPLPVFVVNSGGASLPGHTSRFRQQGGGTSIAEQSLGATVLGSGSKFMKVAGRLGAVGAIAGGTYEALTGNNKESIGSGIGMAIGGALGLFGGPLGVMIGSSLGSAAGGYLGSIFDDIKRVDEIKAQEKKRQREQERISTGFSKISNDIHLVIDNQGVRMVKQNSSNPEQTKIDLDVGYTRMYNNEA